jgi:hypothetical protein
MIEDKYIKIGERAMARDPRKFSFGYLTGGSFVFDSVRVFVWFKSLEEMAKHILEVEPRIYDLLPGEGLEEYQEKLRPITEKLIDKGFSELIRKKINEQSKKNFVIEWWGTYESLRAGKTSFSREIIHDFHERNEEMGKSISEKQEKHFIRFLKEFSI